MSKHLTHTKDLNKKEILEIFKYAKTYLDEKKKRRLIWQAYNKCIF